MGNHVLDNVRVWDMLRKTLDIFFGMYRHAETRMRDFGIDRNVSLLDVGCGTGQHSQVTDGAYVGIDSDARYIAQAQKKYGSPTKRFICQRVQDMDFGGRTFEISLLANVLHHISDPDVRSLLAVLAKCTTKHLVVFDPTTQHHHNYIGRWLNTFDRGNYIRSPEQELALISEHFTVERVIQAKTFFTEGVAVFARPK